MLQSTCHHFAVYSEGARTPRRVVRWSGPGLPTPAEQARNLRRQRGTTHVEQIACDCRPQSAVALSSAGESPTPPQPSRPAGAVASDAATVPCPPDGGR